MPSFRMILFCLRLYFSASNFHIRKTPQAELRTSKVKFLYVFQYCGFSISKKTKIVTVVHDGRNLMVYGSDWVYDCVTADVGYMLLSYSGLIVSVAVIVILLVICCCCCCRTSVGLTFWSRLALFIVLIARPHVVVASTCVIFFC